MLPSHLRQIAERFALEGEYLSAHPYGEGHINDTLRVVTTGGQYVLQRISTAVFPHPEQVMENIENVIRFLTKAILSRGGDPLRETLTLVPLKTGGTFFIDENGDRIPVGPGDSCTILPGQSHGIENAGDTDLVFMALIYNA